MNAAHGKAAGPATGESRNGGTAPSVLPSNDRKRPPGPPPVAVASPPARLGPIGSMPAPALAPRSLIRCLAPRDGEANPCGVLTVEQVAQASEAGLCCLSWLARLVDTPDRVKPPAGPLWAPFEPSDDDVPGGDR